MNNLPSLSVKKLSINMWLRVIINMVLKLKWDVCSLNIKTYYKITAALLFSLLVLPVYAGDTDEYNIYTERYRQAGHPATTENVFENLSVDKDPSIRKRVASNRKTPKRILVHLAGDLNQSVKIALATNLSAPDDVFLILARDPVLAVRSVVARFEYVPVAALEILATDKDADIRLEVARNLNATKVILHKLTKDSDNAVSAIAEQAIQRLTEEQQD